MSRKFTKEEEEIIIEFVKSNEVLYKAAHAEYRNAIKKNRLWHQLGLQFNCSGKLNT